VLLSQCATGIPPEGDPAPPIRHVLRRQRNVEVPAEMQAKGDKDYGEPGVVPPRASVIAASYKA